MGISVKKSTKNEKKFPKMESIAFKLIFVAFAVFTVSAVNKGEDDIMKILAKEREETREERKQLTAERQEMREMFRRESARLDEEDKRQREENQQLKAQIAKLDKEDKKQQKQNQKLKEENNEQQDQIAKLRQKLRRADAKIKQSIRQKDQNNSLEVTMVKKFIRQDDVHSELKKIIRNEMQTFLKEERLCVGGRRNEWLGGEIITRETVEFGYTFPRVPTVIASLAGVRSYGNGGAYLEVRSVSNSSAAIYIDTKWSDRKMKSFYTWLACL